MNPLRHRRHAVLIDDEQQVSVGRRQVLLLGHACFDPAESLALERHVHQPLARIRGVRRCARMQSRP